MAGRIREAGCNLGSASEEKKSALEEITRPKSSWVATQTRLLEMIASGTSIEQVLHYLVLGIEAELDQAWCSILLVRDGCLWTVAAPSLPRTYNDFISGEAIGPGVGSCGNTASTGQPTIVADIATHPFWVNYRGVALQHGLHACWSTPILAGDHTVLATFAIYHGRPMRPNERDFALIRGATHIAGIALERQRSDDVLRRQAQALRDADRRKDVFLAALSHELRNPLAPILTTVQALEHSVGAEDADRVRRGLKVIERQTRHLMRLIDELLDLARVTAGKIVLHQEPVGIAELVQQAVDQIAHVVAQHGNRLHLDVPKEPLLIYADSVRIVQVIANLLGNAAKYTLAGGDVWLTVGRHGDGVELTVRDTGIGITAGALARIFDLYAQVELPPAGMSGGLGIGLALVKNLVEQHGGRVTAASEGLGRGSQFRVWLPAWSGEDREPAKLAAAAPAALLPVPRRVLVVDDNTDAAEMLGLALESTGCLVQLAACGKDALAQAAAWHPDVIILDIGLPDLSGYEVARRLRAQPARPCRIIALTGYGQPSDVARAKAAGFDQLLTKPSDLDDILAAIAGG